MLTGDLEDNTDTEKILNDALSSIVKHGRGEWIIEADRARIGHHGFVRWIRAVNTHLKDFELHYTSSQLGTILHFDDGYHHPKSTFEI